MNLTDYSSIFELLCAYNLVNSINESNDAFKLLDLATPMKEKINFTICKINKRIAPMLDSDSAHISSEEKDRRFSILYPCREKAGIIQSKTRNHEVLVSNLYLIGGIFCFFFLLFSGLSVDFRKLNSFIIMITGTFLVYILFLYCDHVRANAGLKYTTITILAILAVFFVLEMMGIIPVWRRTDELYWVPVCSLILLLSLIFFRKRIVKRKSAKSIIIILFILAFFIPHSSFGYNWFYDQAGNGYNYSIFSLVISAIVAGVLPFFYDIIKNTFFNARVSKIEKEVEYEHDKKEFNETLITATDSEINPIKDG